MRLLFSIILVVLIIIAVYIGFKLVGSNKVHLSSIKSASKTETIKSSDLPANATSSNYAYSIWFYVKDWQYRYTETKTLLSRSSQHLGNTNNPLITFAPYENNIDINITTYPISKANTYSDTDEKEDSADTGVPINNPSCVIKNFPLQKWTNLILSLNGRTADVYLNGKLVRTCVLAGVPKIDATADIHITPNSGFSGWTSNVKYWAHPLNPQQAYNVYRKGYGSGMVGGLGNLFNKFKLKVSYYINNVEQGSVEV